MALDFGPRGNLVEVEEGSKPAVEGVMSAFRFCVMLSSIAALDIRKKSARNGKPWAYKSVECLYLLKQRH
jgi:hypothetical protein